MTGRAGLRACVIAFGLGNPTIGLGRAGGGAHGGAVSFGHGGGSGFQLFGGGLSFGGIITLLILGIAAWYIYRRFFGGPGAGEVLGAVVGAVAADSIGSSARPMPPGFPPTPPDRPGLPAALATIRNSDPGFEIETFLQRAEMTFFLVKRGLQRNDPPSIRPYVDDAVFAIVSRNLGQMAAQHRHTLLESLNVRAVHLVDAAHGDQDQRLLVHFDLVYRAKTLDDANRVLADEGQDGRHGERWTFTRAATARTPASGGVIASRCPVCGAELRLSLDGTCTHCRASVTNGTVDWVVSDVQAAPFVGYAADSMLGIAAPTPAEGIASLRAADPAFDWNAFATRVTTAFRALQDAWCKQDLEAGRAFLSPGCYFGWRAQLETMAAEGRRNVVENLVVQGLEPIRVIHGRVFDDLTVRIGAAAADYEVDAAGKIVFGDRSVRPFVEEWTFQRSIGLATSAKAGTLESTCPNCGAPLVLTQIGECRYCKAAVTSGRFDWVVSRIEQEDDGSRSDGGDADSDIGTTVAKMVGGAVVGSLLSSLLSDRRE